MNERWTDRVWEQKTACARRDMLKIADFTHAVTFSLKQGQTDAHGLLIPLKPEFAQHQMKIFYDRVNSAVFKNAYKRHTKKLAWVSVLGRGTEGRLHFHLAIEFPMKFSFENASQILIDKWMPLEWSHSEMRIEKVDSDGWANYMADHGTDSLDFANYHYKDKFIERV